MDSWTARVLVVATRGRVLPRAGAAAEGRLHGQGLRFNGRAPGGRYRAEPDPADTRLAALAGRRVPARERVVDRRRAALDGARGPGWIVAAVRLAVARAALRRAQRQAERHRDDLDAGAAGYRPLAGRGRDRRR